MVEDIWQILDMFGQILTVFGGIYVDIPLGKRSIEGAQKHSRHMNIQPTSLILCIGPYNAHSFSVLKRQNSQQLFKQRYIQAKKDTCLNKEM